MVWGINALKVGHQHLTGKQSIPGHIFLLSNGECQNLPGAAVNNPIDYLVSKVPFHL
jgi:hypothetical protein